MEETIDSYISWFEEIWGVEVHPKAIELLDEPFFWDDRGTFVFGTDEDQESYYEMSRAYKAKPDVSFFEILRHLDYTGPVKFTDLYELNPQVIQERTKTEGYFFVQVDYLIFEYAIGQLQFQGTIDKELKLLVANAVQRQNMPLFLDYFKNTDRVTQLSKIKEAVLNA